ncbi:MAG TPA: glutamate-1-semialdehyde 2,1-aminomutase [bacterium]
MQNKKSEKLFNEAKAHIPGGVNSPVRAYKSVGGIPPFIASAKGSRIRDVDGNDYIDFVCSWGPMILGHSPKDVLNAVTKRLGRGTSYGAPTGEEVLLAKEIKKAFPAMELVRLVSSGTEATMSAIRVARGYTGKKKIVKFEGCYHGHSDYLLVKAGSGALTLNLPDSAGVPEEFVRYTLVLPYNDLPAVEALLKSDNDIAAVIVEPVAGNMGVVLPGNGFLEGLRRITKEAGVLLIFDEVITGFRLSKGGAQSVFKIKPDLICLGKILGGGFPIGAFGGKKEIMSILAPDGPVYQAGTLSGNPIAVTAGLATLKALKSPLYKRLDRLARRFTDEIVSLARAAGIPMTVNRAGSMFTFFFTNGPVRNFAEAKRSDAQMYARFFHGLLERGVMFPPSQFEACFISSAHTENDLDKVIQVCKKILKK